MFHLKSNLPSCFMDECLYNHTFSHSLQYMGDIDTQINSISTSIDLSSFQILSKDLENTLNDFKNSGIGNLNFTVINDTVSTSATIDCIGTLLQAECSKC